MSIATLLAMPSAAGLFARAVTQSGAAANTLTAEQGLAVSTLLAHTLDVPHTRSAIAAVPPDRLVAAASQVFAEIQTDADPAKWGSLALSGLPFAPVIDGTVLPVHPLDAARAGRSASVPLLTGWNRDEDRLFLVAANMLDAIDEAALFDKARTYGLKPEAIEIYRAARPGATPGDLLAAVGTDWVFAIPALRYAEARVAGGAASTWVYRFDHLEPARQRRLRRLPRHGGALRLPDRGSRQRTGAHRRPPLDGGGRDGARRVGVVRPDGHARLGTVRHDPPPHGTDRGEDSGGRRSRPRRAPRLGRHSLSRVVGVGSLRTKDNAGNVVNGYARRI